MSALRRVSLLAFGMSLQSLFNLSILLVLTTLGGKTYAPLFVAVIVVLWLFEARRPFIRGMLYAAALFVIFFSTVSFTNQAVMLVVFGLIGAVFYLMDQNQIKFIATHSAKVMVTVAGATCTQCPKCGTQMKVEQDDEDDDCLICPRCGSAKYFA